MKKVFIGVLAALMLFAFTACEQQIPNMLPDEVSYIEVNQLNPVLVGTAFDATNFEKNLSYFAVGIKLHYLF